MTGSMEVDSLCDKISVVTDMKAENNYPEQLSASIEIYTTQGNFQCFLEAPAGEPEAFPDESILLEKFLTLANPVLGDRQALELASRVLAIDDEPDLTSVIALTRSR